LPESESHALSLQPKDEHRASRLRDGRAGLSSCHSARTSGSGSCSARPAETVPDSGSRFWLAGAGRPPRLSVSALGRVQALPEPHLVCERLVQGMPLPRRPQNGLTSFKSREDFVLLGTFLFIKQNLRKNRKYGKIKNNTIPIYESTPIIQIKT